MKNLFGYFIVFSFLAMESAFAMKDIKLPVISSYGRNPNPTNRMIASNHSSITVIKVEDSKFESAEKWIDSSAGVVCYSIGSSNKKSISCVKIK